MAIEIAAPKGAGAKAKKNDFEALRTLKTILKGKWPVPKLRKSADKSLSQP